jgi:hypothetical protein
MINCPKVTDISFFSKMPFLMQVNIRNTGVTNVESLSELKYLETIFLPLGNEGIDTSPLTRKGIGFRG